MQFLPIGIGAAFLFMIALAASIPKKKETTETGNGDNMQGAPINPEEYISPHFQIKEVIRSNTAARLGIPNIPTPEHLNNAKQFANNTLEKIRTILGAPIKINSWYRSQAVNDAIPGSANDSVHMTGFAADIAVPYGMDKVTAFKKLVKAVSDGNLQVGELIIYRDTNHFHVTEFPKGGRNELLIAKKEGGPTYVAWSDENWRNGRV